MRPLQAKAIGMNLHEANWESLGIQPRVKPLQQCKVTPVILHGAGCIPRESVWELTSGFLFFFITLEPRFE